MSEDTYFEIDEPGDWTVTEALMTKRETVADEPEENGIPTQQDKKPKIKYKMFLTDCDGCMTDAGMYYSEKGDELKKFNTRDGVAFGMLRENGIITGVITGEDVALNRRRCEKLKIDVLAPGCEDKVACINRLCATYKIKAEEVVYIGDDIADIDAVSFVGLGCCPADACQAVKDVAVYITKAKGGEGVIREVVEKILAGEE